MNEDQVLLDGERVRILGNTSTEGSGEETLRTWHQDESRVMRCLTLTTPAKTVVSRRRLMCQENVPE